MQLEYWFNFRDKFDSRKIDDKFSIKIIFSFDLIRFTGNFPVLNAIRSLVYIVS